MIKKIIFEFYYRHEWIPSHPTEATSGVHQQICQRDRPPTEQVTFRMTMIYYKYSTNIPQQFDKYSTASPATCVKNHELPSYAFNNIRQQICQRDTPTAEQVVCIVMLLSTNDNNCNNNKKKFVSETAQLRSRLNCQLDLLCDLDSKPPIDLTQC